MNLRSRLGDPTTRRSIAEAAVEEGRLAVRERAGLAAIAAQAGLATIDRLRPGFLERHVYELLPDLASALEPYWLGDIDVAAATAHLEAHRAEATTAMLSVTDRYVERASDATAIGVYRHLRPRAERRVGEQMPRIARFVHRHDASPGHS